MIRRLRVTFIVVSLASMAAVLLVILGVVNWMNYRQVVNDADRVLDILAENNGTFPEREIPVNLWDGKGGWRRPACPRRRPMRAGILPYVSGKTERFCGRIWEG